MGNWSTQSLPLFVQSQDYCISQPYWFTLPVSPENKSLSSTQQPHTTTGQLWMVERKQPSLHLGFLCSAIRRSGLKWFCATQSQWTKPAMLGHLLVIPEACVPILDISRHIPILLGLSFLNNPHPDMGMSKKLAPLVIHSWWSLFAIEINQFRGPESSKHVQK